MKTNGQLLQEKLDEALAEGEVPYKANRDAVRSFDIFRDVEDGLIHADRMVAGIGVFVEKLEGFKDVAAAVAGRADTLVR